MVAPLTMDSAMMTEEKKEGLDVPTTCNHPVTTYCIGQSELKGEDVVFVEHQRIWPGADSTEHSVRTESTIDIDSANTHTGGPRWMPADFPPACPHCGTSTSHYSLYCVFDGHNGVHAAKMAGDTVLPLVESRLPLGCPPPPDHEAYMAFREGVQLALVETVVEMNSLFAQRGIHAGATATIVLQVGWLVTAANLGDSRAVLDTGADTVLLAADHRVASHKAERRRVEAMGAIVAPLAMWGTGPADDYASGVGPLRIWPGGLSISRAIGDFDVGEAVLPFPHVTQVLLPPTGGRLLVGSDGVWDAFDKMSRAGSMSRSWSTEAAPSRMIQTIVRAFGGLKDDTSLIVVDILNPGVTFQQLAVASKKGTASPASSLNGIPTTPKAGGGSGFCFCFGSSSTATIDAGGSLRPATTIADSSVRSSASNNSVSVRSGSGGFVRPRAEVLASVDVAGIMGLMPEPELIIPGWYSPEVGEALFLSASSASDTWRATHEKRYARPPPTPAVPDAIERPKRRGSSRKSVAFAVADEKESKTEQAGGVRRNASMHFSGATADDGKDFAAKFGHYKGAEGAGSAGAGPSFLTEPSVRAGRLFNSEASVRAGNALHLHSPEDPSVRLRGSNMEGSLHMKASDLPPPEEVAGLAPVRTVKRTGQTPSAPVLVPSRANGGSQQSDSAKEHPLERLSSIGE